MRLLEIIISNKCIALFEADESRKDLIEFYIKSWDSMMRVVPKIIELKKVGLTENLYDQAERIGNTTLKADLEFVFNLVARFCKEFNKEYGNRIEYIKYIKKVKDEILDNKRRFDAGNL